jgi:hypothetical protein
MQVGGLRTASMLTPATANPVELQSPAQQPCDPETCDLLGRGDSRPGMAFVFRASGNLQDVRNTLQAATTAAGLMGTSS